MAKSDDFFIVGIGASAGGLEAISELLAQLPSENSEQAAYIIAQHLSPHYKSMLAQLLRRETPLKVVEAENAMPIEAGHIYITPPDNEIKIEQGRIILGKPQKAIGPKPSVDILFSSMAREKKQRAIGVILSGTGSDGANGINDLKAAGGFTISQDPSTAKYDGMPLAAIRTGNIDLILTAEEIGKELEKIIKNPRYLQEKRASQQNEYTQEAALERVFELLSNRTGTNFSNYKPSTIHRRLSKRLSTLNLNSVDKYLQYVEQNPAEIDLLFNTILIGVTSFFRDGEAFKRLKKNLKDIIDKKQKGENIRIWVTGCATGEEAYSIAIIISELIRNTPHHYKVQIFATDIDEEALNVARRGIYQENALNNISQDLRKRYFLKRENNNYELSKSIRSMVLFSKHDVTAHPPFLRLDLISCRNLLIYFNLDLQKHVLPIFHYALNSGGFLFLGKSETIGQFSDLFATVDSKLKLFQKKENNGQQSITFSVFRPKRYDAASYRSKSFSTSQPLSDKIRETLFNAFDFPYILVNENLNILEIKGNVRDFLSFPEGNVNLNLIKLVHEDLQIILRRLMTLAVREHSVQRSKLRRYRLFDKYYYLRLVVRPIIAIEENTFLIIFEQYDIEEELSQIVPKSQDDQDNVRLSELEQELAATKEHLQTYIEEIETANEELQSLNEELQSANEELQSSNEELETSNEELQSTNEEIQIAYGELKSANEALERKEELLLEANANVKALLNHTEQGFILIGKNQTIKSFNSTAQQLIYKLTQKSLFEGELLIDFMPPSYLPSYQSYVQNAFKSEDGGHRQHFNIGTQDFWLYLKYTPVTHEIDESVNSIVVSLVDLSLEQNLKTSLLKTERLLDSVFDAVSVGVCVTDEQGKFVNVNHQYCQTYGYSKEELIGQSFTMIVPPEGRIYAQNLHDSFIEGGEEPPAEWQVQRKDGSLIDVFVYAVLLEQEDGKRYKVTSVRDITESRKYRNLLLETQKTARVGGWEYDIITQQLSWTDEVYEILDVSEQEFQPNIEQMIALPVGNSRKLLNQSLENAIFKGEAFDIELEIEDKSTVWVRATCKPIRIGNRTIKLFGTFQDISQQKSNQQELLKLSLVASHVNNGVMLINKEGLIEWVNEGLLRMLGENESHFKDQIIDKFYKVMDNAEKSIIALIRQQDFISLEAEHKTQNQEKRWLQIDITAVKNKKQQVVNYIAIVSDISERRRSKIQLQASEENYRKLARNIPNTDIYLFDKDLRFIIVEGTSMPKHNLTPSHFENKRLEETLDKDTVAYLKPLYEKTLQGEKVYSEFAYQGHHYLHQSVPIRNAEGEIQAGLFLSTDITRLKQAEEGLRKSQASLSLSQQIAKLGSWHLDLESQNLYLSTEHLKIMGIEAQEEQQMPLMDFATKYLHPDDVHIIEDKLKWALENHDPDYEDQLEYRIKDYEKPGEYKHFSVKSYFLSENKIFGVTQDVSEQKQGELQKEKLINNLKSFAFITSHNLRRPLANILGLIDVINFDDPSDPFNREVLNNLQDSASQLDEIIHEMNQAVSQDEKQDK